MSAISVVICTRNRADMLRRSLETLAQQTCASPWEVLVVDNGSEDATVQLVERLSTDFPVRMRVHTEAQPGLSFARNAALEVAEGDALLFLDDDVSCRPGLLEAHAAMYARPEVMATAGRILPDLPPETPPWFRALMSSDIGGPTARYDFGAEACRIGPQGGRRLPHPFGANMGVRRKAALDVRGFRTDLGWGKTMVPGEETEFFLRIQARGGAMYYVPEAAVEHHIQADRVTREYALRWREGYGRSLVRVHPPPRGFRVRRKVLRTIRAELRRLDALARERREREDSLGVLVAELDRAEVRGRLLELTGR